MPDIILTASPGGHGFTQGEISLDQGTLLLVPTFESFITDSQQVVEPEDERYDRIDFRSGTITFLTAAKTNLLLVGSEAHQFSEGVLGITVYPGKVVGALAKFSHWPTTAPADPAEVLVQARSGATAGGVGQAWGRVNATFTPSKDTQYLGVGSRWANVQSSPQGGVAYRQYIRKVQVEKAAIGGSYPTSYEKARQINVTVRPERVNLTDATSPTTLGSTKTQGISYDGVTWERHTTTVTGQGARVMVPVNVLRTGEYYTGSVEVANDGATAFQIRLDWCDADAVLFTILPGTRQVLSITSNRGGLPYDSTYRFMDVELPTPGNFLLRNPMIEKGRELRPYFNGSTSSDTIWGGAANTSMSYYYKDRVARYAAIKRILESNAPMGIGVGEPVFGTLPADW